MAKLIEIDRARELVLARTHRLGGEPVGLAEALGRVIAEDVLASEAVPAFDNSAIDGFAVRSTDTSGAAPSAGVTLRLIDESRAGLPARSCVSEGEAIRISTGAMLPEGADAVVRVEDTEVDRKCVSILAAVTGGRGVRRAGDDIVAGSLVLAAGTVLGPSELGVLASVGRGHVACARRPAVAVLTTGDELLEPEERMRPGSVRNTNSYTIPALADRSGATVRLRRTVSDELRATRDAIADALGHDVLVLCGGVSVGEHDHVREALAGLGVEQVFWGLALRPGKPTWFGVSASGSLVFGLPGNPVSAIVTFLLLVRPALRALLGAETDRDMARAFLDEDYGKSPGRAHALRCRLELREDGWHARSTGAQGSHVLTSMLGADALALIPTASHGVRAGELVEVEVIPGA